MELILWKIYKIVAVIILLVTCIGVLITKNFFIGFIIFFILFILIFTGLIFRKRNGFVGYIYLYYTMIVGPINLLLSMISPKSLKVQNINKYYDIWVFSDNKVIVKYVCYLLIFYTVSMVTVFLFQNRIKTFNYIITMPKLLSIKRPLIFAFFASLAQYYIRITYNISIPGYIAEIPFSGIIIYFFEIINYYLLFLILVKNISYNKKPSIGNFLQCILGGIITQLSNILIGLRVSIINVFLLMGIYYFVIHLDINSYMNSEKNKKRFLLPFVVAIIFAFIGLGITNQLRTGEFETIGFIVRRITGLFDGSIFLHYITSLNIRPPMSISDFFMMVVKGKGVIPNDYYTNLILGYPTTLVHSSAAPVFVTSWYFGGINAIIVISTYLASIMSIVQRILDKNIKGYLLTNKIYFNAGIYCSLHAALIVTHNNFIDGNITFWKILVVPLGCYLLVKITKHPSSKKLIYYN